MTIKQFVKKYVPKDKQMYAEDDLFIIIQEAEDRRGNSLLKEIIQDIRYFSNELKGLYS